MLWNSLFLEREAMLKNGNDEKIDKAIERMLDAREKNKTVVSLLIIIISLFLLLFLSVQFFRNS